MFSFLRRDVLYFSQNLFLPFVIAVSMLTVTAYVKKRYFAETDDEDGDWWNFSNLRTHDYEQWWELTRLRPFDQIFNPTVGIFSTGEDVLDMSQAVISKAYIQHLPCWQYRATVTVCKCRLSAAEARGPCSSCIGEAVDSMGDQNILGLQHSVCEGIANTLMDSNYRCECAQGGPCPQHESQGHQNQQSQGQHDIQGQELQHIHQGQGQTHSSNNTNSTAGQLTKHDLHSDPFKEFTNSYTVKSINKMSHRPEGYIESHQCVICIEDYKVNVLLRGLPCGHVFHAQCIGAWLMRDNHFCPVCRWPSFKPKEAHLTNSLHTE